MKKIKNKKNVENLVDKKQFRYKKNIFINIGTRCIIIGIILFFIGFFHVGVGSPIVKATELGFILIEIGLIVFFFGLFKNSKSKKKTRIIPSFLYKINITY